MTDTTSPLPSPYEPVVDRNRRWSPVWYPWIKKLLDNIRTQANALFSIEETIDEINGKWSLSLNENGRVIGAITLDGSGSQTELAILADKFIVVHPSIDGTTIQAFVVGTIAGVPTIGVNGNLIVDGSIQAVSLDVAELSAIVANLGTVVAGRLQNAGNTTFFDLDTGEFQITAAS